VIEEIGVVISAQGDMAEVEGQRRSTCGGCAVNGACGTSLISRYFGRRRPLMVAHNAIGAEPGDRVVFGLPEGALLEASFVAYLVPLLAMMGGAILGDYLAGLWAPAYAQGISVLSGFGALAFALAWLRRFGRTKASDSSYRPRILRRVGQRGQAVIPPILSPSGKRYTDGA
jgi:sigma-E factor negative regulatory protein RseC